MYVCPADTIAASPDIVWGLLTDPATYSTWTDGHLESADPPGRARAGQVIRLTTGFLGLRLKIRFDIVRADGETHNFEFDGQFPLGLTMHEHITVRPVNGHARVQYG